MPMREYTDEEGSSLVTSRGARQLKPSMLIAIYSIEDAPEKYLESAYVDSKGRVMSFYPLSTNQVHDFAEKLLLNKTKRNATTFGGWTADRIMYVAVQGTSLSIVWRRDPGTAGVRYNKDLKIPDGEIAVPGMIFTHSKDTSNLYVWAYKEYKGADTMLFHLPFHNVYSNGRICMGQSRTRFMPKDSFETYCTRWEWLFFNTAGSEIHYPAGFDTNINTLHKQLREGAPFPIDKLIQYGKLKDNKINHI